MKAGPWLVLMTVGLLSSPGGAAKTRREQRATPRSAGETGPRLPLVLVADVNVPGKATRFDYQDIDPVRGQLVVAHMNDASVWIADLHDGSTKKLLRAIQTPRGVATAPDVGRIFVTSSPRQLVVIDSSTLGEMARVETGDEPDGVAWDAVHKTVGVSDQGDGALSLIAGSGTGKRTQVPLGKATGNVVYDGARGWFWITVEQDHRPDELVAVDPPTAKVTVRIGLPGCDSAHGLRLHPDGKSAFVACESNDLLMRVSLDGDHAIATGTTGAGPDVLSLDPGLGWLYVAAESGDLTVFDIRQEGVALLGHDHPGPHAHTVAVDPATHRVFFPLPSGPKGTPVLRIMRPTVP